ncbi:hypothetical protein GE061_011509 [Apolygus lucorum]|uniref:Uncharacterized protein n=1 Tax=Apolygus lucorum TaxID=248454 RepID=A0A8S9XY15_APOLU|nr:hypothetical protein GE061_011509 [Apolygus lucorum]
MQDTNSADATNETISIVGRLREFTPANDWTIAKPRMNNFFEANGIKKDERKRALMLNSLDESAYKLITGLGKKLPKRGRKLDEGNGQESPRSPKNPSLDP